MMAHQTLVLGLGDVSRGDDGIGPLVVADLVADYELDPAILVMDARAVGVRLLPFLASVRHLLVVAAVRLGADAGTLHRLEWAGTADDLGPRLPPVRHEGVEVLRMLHFWVDPVPDLVLLGVEAMRPAATRRMSPAVEHARSLLMLDAAGELRRWNHRVEHRVPELTLKRGVGSW